MNSPQWIAAFLGVVCIVPLMIMTRAAMRKTTGNLEMDNLHRASVGMVWLGVACWFLVIPIFSPGRGVGEGGFVELGNLMTLLSFAAITMGLGWLGVVISWFRTRKGIAMILYVPICAAALLTILRVFFPSPSAR
jgi:hypothetical protein